MRNPFTAIAIGIGIGFTTVTGVNAYVNRVTDLAIEQCNQQDWPAEQHMAHVAYCHYYHGIDVR